MKENKKQTSNSLEDKEMELSPSEICQSRNKCLQDFAIAFYQYADYNKPIYNWRTYQYLRYLQCNFLISTIGQKLDEFSWIDITNLLDPIKKYYKRKIGVERVYIDSFEKFLNDAVESIGLLLKADK